MPEGTATYPKREKFYSHRFCRLLTKTCAAQELGPEVCWLLTVVAHQEDVKRYRGPVTYWNEQLMPLCGFGGRSRLVLARDKAVEAGWLHYEAGTKGKPGTYWTTIPAHFAETPDAPMDESSDEFCRTEIGRQTTTPVKDSKECRPESGHQVGRQTDGIRTANGRNPDGNQDGKPAPFLPVPIPSPNPNPRIEEPPARPHKKSDAYKRLIPAHQEAVDRWADYWNATQNSRWHDSQCEAALMDATRLGLTTRLPDVIDFSISRNCKSWKNPDDDFDKQRKNGSHSKPRLTIDDALKGI